MVSVMMSSTTGTGPLSIGKGEPIIQRATYMAHLAGWEPLINFDKDFSAIPEFILQHVAEHPKTVIVGGLAQLQRTSHSAQVDIFHKDSIVPLGYRGTQLLAEVPALIGHFLVPAWITMLDISGWLRKFFFRYSKFKALTNS